MTIRQAYLTFVVDYIYYPWILFVNIMIDSFVVALLHKNDAYIRVDELDFLELFIYLVQCMIECDWWFYVVVCGPIHTLCANMHTKKKK